MSPISCIHTICFILILQYCVAQIHVWPSPKHLVVDQGGKALSISSEFRFALKGKGLYSDVKTKSMERIKTGIARMNNVLKNKNINYNFGNADKSLKSLEIQVVSRSDSDDYPSSKTKYDYNITINDNTNTNTSLIIKLLLILKIILEF